MTIWPIRKIDEGCLHYWHNFNTNWPANQKILINSLPARPGLACVVCLSVSLMFYFVWQMYGWCVSDSLSSDNLVIITELCKPLDTLAVLKKPFYYRLAVSVPMLNLVGLHGNVTVTGTVYCWRSKLFCLLLAIKTIQRIQSRHIMPRAEQICYTSPMTNIHRIVLTVISNNLLYNLLLNYILD